MLVEMNGWPWASCEVPKIWVVRVQFLLSSHHNQMVASYLSSDMDACLEKMKLEILQMMMSECLTRRGLGA